MEKRTLLYEEDSRKKTKSDHKCAKHDPKESEREKVAPEPRSGPREVLRPSERESPIILETQRPECDCE